MQNLFVNGCSFNGPRKKWGKHVNTYVGKQIADHYKIQEHRFARGGRGNRRICDTTKLFFESNPGRKLDTLAMIQWTSPGRRDYPTNDDYKKIDGYSTTWRTWSTHEQIKFISSLEGFDIERDHSLMQLNDIIDLQNYFNVHGIKYVMYFGLVSQIDLTQQDHKILHNAIDWNKFYQPDTSHYEFCEKNNLQISPQDEHPSAEGHRKWAEGLIKYIDEVV